MDAPALWWLPQHVDFRACLRVARDTAGEAAWPLLTEIARSQLDFAETNALDQVVERRLNGPEGGLLGLDPVRIAVLGSSTTTHLHPALRIAALRRGHRAIVWESDYGAYEAALADPEAGLPAFAPDIILFALDSHHLARGLDPDALSAEANRHLDDTVAHVVACWRRARGATGATVLHQAALPVFPLLLGNNEHRIPGAPGRFVDRLNERLRAAADEEGVHLVSVDHAALRHGIHNWHDPVLWHRAKQTVALRAAPAFGEFVWRVIAAARGRSAKCLVLDLDNTLWGGVIGDDGLEGIVLGQGSAEGEAFAALQRYALDLSKRGIVLAVCSKNDEAVAHDAFDRHPEMVLGRGDIASFVANWDDKASNLRRIAAELDLGLDALVFLDDNPVERDLVRRELPSVAVPEMPTEPALVPRLLSDAGYFEALALTDEDRSRASQYRANRKRREGAAGATDLEGHLRNLEMTLRWSPFDRIGLQRIVQLMNKTNQCNLATRRVSDAEIRALMADDRSFGLQFRLKDRFGDNGMIAVVTAEQDGDDAVIRDWLMSCRVLGRRVEEGMLAVIASVARSRGASRLVGEYRPTPKNGMVAGHYRRLGFATGEPAEDGSVRSTLHLAEYRAPDLLMAVEGTWT